ncbi:hypothetical protein [Confluentibacter citreus]|uniref:hypothetical protein n=1 Tax=Confluentibacter citreus TaxID=2007307 RepID=UPI0012FDDC07|nr:hypothetical protein [Confluentibacter citreus]
MMYKDAFAIDTVHYIDRKAENNNNSEKYKLKNFDYYAPKLVEDFYLKYFIREALFELHISKLKDFLQYHYDYCELPDVYFFTLENEVLIKISEIIETACFSIGGGYYKEVKLEDGFIETEDTILNPLYEYTNMLHLTAIKNLQFTLKKKADIIESFLSQFKDTQESEPLKWIAGPSQLAFIISELINKGYMTADKKSGDINYSKLSKDIAKAFCIKESNSTKSLEIYLSPNNKKHKTTKERFEKSNFYLPDSKFT